MDHIATKLSGWQESHFCVTLPSMAWYVSQPGIVLVASVSSDVCRVTSTSSRKTTKMTCVITCSVWLGRLCVAIQGT